jgi:hypothetical protein
VEGMILNKQKMMHINNDKFEYIVDNDVLTVSYSGIEDIFDFTDVSDGKINFTNIETILPHNPIISAKKENDVLTVTVIDFVFSESMVM